MPPLGRPTRRLLLGAALALSILAAGSIVLATGSFKSTATPPASVADAHGTPLTSRPLPLIVVPGRASHGRLLFIGASYTAAVGASSLSDGYAELTARRLGCPAYIDAVPGTGYLNPGTRRQGTFAERLMRLSPSLNPAVVVFQGGRDDTGYPTDALRRAILHTISLARARFRRAEIVLLGPVPGTWPVSRGQLHVEQVLRSVSASAHVPFLDPIAERWMTAAAMAGFSGRVPDHPNDSGYAYIASRVVGDLTRVAGRQLGIGSSPQASSPAREPALART